MDCIPEGEYDCALTYSPRFKKLMWEVLDVPGDRTGIRIHSANRPSQLEGCIAPGMVIDLDANQIKKSQEAYQKLLESIGSCKKFKLIIKGKKKTK
jgi:hypothetical protein